MRKVNKELGWALLGGLNMSSIIEKITLYDFFGYLVPGSVFTSLLGLRGMQEFGGGEAAEMQDYISVYVVLFLLWGFLFGLLLSEVARIVSDFADIWLKDKYVRKIRKCAYIDTAKVKMAIEKSGIAENVMLENDIDFLKYLPVIYGVVQSDESYKRIHNYASSETMYKNLSAAVLFGGLIDIIYLILEYQDGYIWVISIVWMLSIALFIHRYYRFRIKKYVYSLIWFVEKYQDKSQ